MGTGEILGLVAIALALSGKSKEAEPVNTSSDFWNEAPAPQGSPSAIVSEWAAFVAKTGGAVIDAVKKEKGW